MNHPGYYCPDAQTQDLWRYIRALLSPVRQYHLDPLTGNTESFVLAEYDDDAISSPDGTAVCAGALGWRRISVFNCLSSQYLRRDKSSASIQYGVVCRACGPGAAQEMINLLHFALDPSGTFWSLSLEERWLVTPSSSAAPADEISSANWQCSVVAASGPTFDRPRGRDRSDGFFRISISSLDRVASATK
ncbi:unnamed protein product [Pleuronectes platessa]|uniref:Uncharacterized protein n=1 Tax=Pleuronectes platessa TaxID=8262 RepID=A0A9N7TKD3_PLEPL|nr:unnamed protein product [Pleuronectes platessa]